MESIVDRWIFLTMGQKCGKLFHIKASLFSFDNSSVVYNVDALRGTMYQFSSIEYEPDSTGEIISKPPFMFQQAPNAVSMGFGKSECDEF